MSWLAQSFWLGGQGKSDVKFGRHTNKTAIEFELAPADLNISSGLLPGGVSSNN